jgi:hypothetical protein
VPVANERTESFFVSRPQGGDELRVGVLHDPLVNLRE